MFLNKEIIITLLSFVCSLFIGSFLIKSNYNNLESNINELSLELLNTHSLILERTIDRSTAKATILGKFIEIQNGSMENFNEYADVLFKQLKGVTNLQLAPNGIVTKIHPLKGHEKAIGHDILKHDKRKKEALLAKRTSKLTLAGPFKLIQGGTAIIARKPIYLQDSFWGFASALIMLDDLIENTQLNKLKEHNFLYRLKRVHPDSGKIDIFYGEKNLPNKNVFSKEVTVPNGKWILDIEYTGKYISTNMLGLLYISVIVISMLLSYLLYIILNKPKELKEINKKIEREKQRFELAINGSDNGVFDWDLLNNDIFYSKRWKEILGYKDHELNNEFIEWEKRVHPKDLKITIDKLNNYLEGNSEVFNATFRMKHKLGHWIWIQARGKANKNSSGIFERMVGFHSDVTELIQYRDSLEKLVKEKTKEQRTLLSLFDIGNSVLFKWNNDVNHTVSYVSENVLDLLGYSKDEFLTAKQDYKSCIYEEDFKIIQEEYNKAVEKNLTYINYTPYRVITKNKKVKWVLDNSIFVRDKKGVITNTLGYLTDITELRSSEQKLNESQRLASMGEMIGNIAHQWRQPLSLISTSATGLKLQKQFGTLEDEQFDKICDSINDNAQYLSDTIDDFKNFIKGDREEVEFNLNDDVESFLKIVEGSIKSHDIKIVKNIDKSINLLGYPSELIQCFINIFNNSKDAYKNNSDIKKRYFFISAEQKAEDIIITFRDNAGGIPKNVIPHLFEPYFTTKHQSQGTGLGLHMTYNLITEGMQGTIIGGNKSYFYDKTELKGAEFIISIPNLLIDLDT